jgi:hypothetical protein
MRVIAASARMLQSPRHATQCGKFFDDCNLRALMLDLLLVSGLSEHLFWDVNPQGVDAERHAVWLAKRVLEYGYWSDWQALVVYYGKARLAQIVVGIRSLNPRAFAFCQAWFQIPATDFRCSNTTPFP